MSECYAGEATASGARLFHLRLDSIPAELAVHKLAQRFGSEEKLATCYTTKGGLNGGTIATMLNKLASGRITV